MNSLWNCLGTPRHGLIRRRPMAAPHTLNYSMSEYYHAPAHPHSRAADPLPRGADLERANLTDADLKGAILFASHLERANLSGAILERANLTART